MSASRIYMHPKAQAAFDAACQEADLRPVITQTLGNAPDSKGVHAKDGAYLKAGKWHDYCAALDISVNQLAVKLSTGEKIKMGEKQIKWFLFCLAKHGFVAWYRYQKAFATKHIHAIYVAVQMKPALESQVVDFLKDKTGLASHAQETFWTANSDLDQFLATMFAVSNPEAAKRLPPQYRGVLA